MERFSDWTFFSEIQVSVKKTLDPWRKVPPPLKLLSALRVSWLRQGIKQAAVQGRTKICVQKHVIINTCPEVLLREELLFLDEH